MAHTLHDVNGFIGHGPTITGRKQLQEFFDGQNAEDYPAIDQLLTHGITDKLPAVSLEASALAKKAQNPNVRGTLESLAKDSKKAKEVVMLAG